MRGTRSSSSKLNDTVGDDFETPAPIDRSAAVRVSNWCVWIKIWRDVRTHDFAYYSFT